MLILHIILEEQADKQAVLGQARTELEMMYEGLRVCTGGHTGYGQPVLKNSAS